MSLAIFVNQKFFAADNAGALLVVNLVRVNVPIPTLYVAEMFIFEATAVKLFNFFTAVIATVRNFVVTVVPRPMLRRRHDL